MDVNLEADLQALMKEGASLSKQAAEELEELIAKQDENQRDADVYGDGRQEEMI